MSEQVETAPMTEQVNGDEFVTEVTEILHNIHKVSNSKNTVRWKFSDSITRPGYALVIDKSKNITKLEFSLAAVLLICMPLGIFLSGLLMDYRAAAIEARIVTTVFALVVAYLTYYFILKPKLPIAESTFLFVYAYDVTQRDLDNFNNQCSNYMDSITADKQLGDNDETNFVNCLKNMPAVADGDIYITIL